MFLSTTFISAYVFLAALAGASDCSTSGLFIDIHERLVDGRTDFFQYGLFIGLGAPSQNNSLWPAITHNETVFSSPDYCNSGTAPACPTNFHGFISTETSSTWRNLPDYQSLDDASTIANTSAVHGIDTMNIWTHYFDPSPATGTFIPDLPVTVVSNYSSTVDPFFGPGGTFGLGPTSTVLSHLYNIGRIAARSYGLYVGTRPDRAGGTQNGSIVLGGYDSGRFTGPLLSYEQVPALPQNAFSPFKVSISQISLVTRQGQEIALVTEGAFDAYLTTSQFPVQFPRTITQRLASALQAVVANNDDNTLKVQNEFNGNLTITLSNNLTFTFDSSWISNKSSISPISAAPLQGTSGNGTTTSGDSSTPILLGASFLEQVYLFVQYDSTPPTFSVAQAQPYGKYVQPRPFCAGMTPVPAVPPKISAFIRQGLTGAVIGGIIGGGALTALIWFCCMIYLKSRRRRKSQSTQEDIVHGKPALTGSLRRLKSKTKRAVRFNSNHDDELKQSTSSKSSKSTVRIAEIEKSSPSSSSLASTPELEQEAIEMSDLPQVGLTIQTSFPSDNKDNIITQEAIYNPPSSAFSSNFNDLSLNTPIPPTPHSAMPLILNDDNQDGNNNNSNNSNIHKSGWPSFSLSQNRNDLYKDARKPSLKIQTGSSHFSSSSFFSSTKPVASSLPPPPTFAPPPSSSLSEQKSKSSKLRNFVARTKR